MEKICIVKRRKQYSEVNDNETMQKIEKSSLEPVDYKGNSDEAENKPVIDMGTIDEFNADSYPVVSITMTAEQSSMLQTSKYIKDLLNGTVKDPALDIKQNPQGQIVLNFRLNESRILRMLRSSQVCEMLQISRSLLTKLIHENKIKSYKVGRLRRFLLEDVLEYLLSCNEFSGLNQKI